MINNLSSFVRHLCGETFSSYLIWQHVKCLPILVLDNVHELLWITLHFQVASDFAILSILKIEVFCRTFNLYFSQSFIIYFTSISKGLLTIVGALFDTVYWGYLYPFDKVLIYGILDEYLRCQVKFTENITRLSYH